MRGSARLVCGLAVLAIVMVASAAMADLSFPGHVPAYIPADNTYQGDMLFDDDSGTVYSVARSGNTALGVVLPTGYDTANYGGVIEFHDLYSPAGPHQTFDFDPVGPPIRQHAVDMTGILSRLAPSNIQVVRGVVHMGSDGKIDWIGFAPGKDEIVVQVEYAGGEYALWSDFPGNPDGNTNYTHSEFLPEAGFDPSKHPWQTKQVFMSGEGADANDGTLWAMGDIAASSLAEYRFKRVLDPISSMEQVRLTYNVQYDLTVTGGLVSGMVPYGSGLTASLDSALGSIGGGGYLPNATFAGDPLNVYDPYNESGFALNGFTLGDTPILTLGLVVPEPASMFFLGTILVGAAGAAYRRRRS